MTGRRLLLKLRIPTAEPRNRVSGVMLPRALLESLSVIFRQFLDKFSFHFGMLYLTSAERKSIMSVGQFAPRSFCFIGNTVLVRRIEVCFYKAKGAHARDWKMPQATALGARVRKRTLCSILFSEGDCVMLEIFKTTDTGEFLRPEQIEKDCWISLTAPSPRELEQVAEATGVELDALRAALDEEERARMELEDNYHLILVDSPEIEKEVVESTERSRYITLPLAIITAKDIVITVTLRETPILQYFKSGKTKDFFTYKKTRFILQIFYRVATIYLQYLRGINRESERLEDKLKESQRNREIMEMHELEKSLVYFTTALRSNEAVFEKLLKTEKVKRYPEDEDLLEDVIIENRQALEMANIYSGILNSTMDTFSSVISNNLNIVMKSLATVTIVMSIPTMIASFYGMNVPLPGQNLAYGFPIVLGIAGLLALIVAVIFRKKDLF